MTLCAKPLLKAVAWPEVRTRVTVDGVIAVVDGPAVNAGRFTEDPQALAASRAADPSLDHDSPLAELFEDQLACADMVILNKSDLMSADERRSAEHTVGGHLRPSVKIVHASFGAIDATTLLGVEADKRCERLLDLSR